MDELATWMASHIRNTFVTFIEWRDEGDEGQQLWCRGRVDAFLQILDSIDKQREAETRAEWESVVAGTWKLPDAGD